MPAFPAKTNYAAGDVLTAAQMKDIGDGLNDLLPDAKGSLTTVSAGNTPAQLTVGNSGETLVADSATTTGLRWQGSMAAGRNFLINGGFDVWQRGTSFSSPSGTAYTVDRWNNNNSAGGTTTISQQTTGVPAGSQYCLRTAYGAASSYSNKAQIIETNNSKMLQGKTITFQVKLRRNATFAANLQIAISKASGTDIGSTGSWTAIQTTTISNASLPTGTGVSDWYLATVTATIPNDGTANTIKVSVNESAVGGSGEYWEMAEAQLELGNVATTFSRSGGTIQGELAACQRYLPVVSKSAIVPGYAYGTNTAIYAVNFKVPARVAPTGITVSGTINAYALNTLTVITPTFNIGSVDTASILGAFTITAGQGSRLELQSDALILFTGCEL